MAKKKGGPGKTRFGADRALMEMEAPKRGLPEGAPRNLEYICLICGQTWRGCRNKEGTREEMCPNCSTYGGEKFIDPETGRESFKILLKNELTNRNRRLAQEAAANLAGWKKRA